MESKVMVEDPPKTRTECKLRLKSGDSCAISISDNVIWIGSVSLMDDESDEFLAVLGSVIGRLKAQQPKGDA